MTLPPMATPGSSCWASHESNSTTSSVHPAPQLWLALPGQGFEQLTIGSSGQLGRAECAHQVSDLGEDVYKVILTPPCIFCMESH